VADVDIHGEALRIEARLRELGDTERADAIDTAIAGGSTGTEILFSLAAEMKEIRRAKAGDRALRGDARRLKRAITRALRV